MKQRVGRVGRSHPGGPHPLDPEGPCGSLGEPLTDLGQEQHDHVQGRIVWGGNSRARAPSERVLTVCEGEEKGPYRPGAVGVGKQPTLAHFRRGREEESGCVCVPPTFRLSGSHRGEHALPNTAVGETIWSATEAPESEIQK